MGNARLGAREFDTVAPQCLGADGSRFLFEDLDDGRVLIADDDGCSGFDDAGLFASDVRARRAKDLDVVELHVGDHRNDAVRHVRRVIPSTEPNLDDRDVDGDVGEIGEPGRSDQLEPSRRNSLGVAAVRRHELLPRPCRVHNVDVARSSSPIG